jgi:WD40 repeat protein
MVTEHGVHHATHEVVWVEDPVTYDSLLFGDPNPRAPRWMSFSPDGKLLAVADAEGSVLFWDMERRKKAYILKPSTSTTPIRVDFPRVPIAPPRRLHDCLWGPLDFSPNGKLLILGNNRGEGMLWDLETNRELQHFDLQQTVRCVAVSPDGETAAFAGHRNVTLWAVKTGEKLATVDVLSRPLSFRGGVFSITFSPDGNTLVIGSSDGTIRLWDTITAVERFTLRQPEGPVGFLAFSSDGQTLVSGHDTTTYLWRGLRRWDN